MPHAKPASMPPEPPSTSAVPPSAPAPPVAVPPPEPPLPGAPPVPPSQRHVHVEQEREQLGPFPHDSQVKPVSDVPPALVTPPAPGIPPVAGGVEPPAPAGPVELPPAPPVRHAASTADGASSASPPPAPPAAVPLLPPVREPPPPPAPPVVVPPLPPRLPPVLAGASDLAAPSAVGPLVDFPQPPRTRNPLVASPIRTWDIRIGRICMKYRSTRRRGQSEKCRGVDFGQLEATEVTLSSTSSNGSDPS